MVSLPLSRPAPRTASGRLVILAGRVAACFEILGAAVRVSQAVESRADADPADLLTLGINRPLPRSW